MTTIKVQKRNRVGAVARQGIVIIALLTIASAAQAQDNQPKRDPLVRDQISASTPALGDPAAFLKEASKINMTTIKFAQLAAQKAENDQLKRFSEMIDRDHAKAQAEVAGLAQRYSVVLPTALDTKCEEELARLQGLTGSEFDKEFAKGAVEGHAIGIAHLQRASTQLKEPEVAKYADRMLAHMKGHQQRARDVARAVGVDEATITELENKALTGVGGPATTETAIKEGEPKVPPVAPKNP